jgi:hypothetical protein
MSGNYDKQLLQPRYSKTWPRLCELASAYTFSLVDINPELSSLTSFSNFTWNSSKHLARLLPS